MSRVSRGEFYSYVVFTLIMFFILYAGCFKKVLEISTGGPTMEFILDRVYDSRVTDEKLFNLINVRLDDLEELRKPKRHGGIVK